MKREGQKAKRTICYQKEKVRAKGEKGKIKKDDAKVKEKVMSLDLSVQTTSKMEADPRGDQCTYTGCCLK